MKNLRKIVENYLSGTTDFALQIVGNWGYGKTHFYRKTIEKLVEETQVHSDASKKYKPIYISLFGLKSTEDIATKIVLDFYQSQWFRNYSKTFLGKRRIKITRGILKIGFRGFLNFKRMGNVNDYLTDIKDIGKDVLDTNELTVCFDDLERKDSSLKIEDLTGYINSLVDEGVKVLIIANEDLLLKGGDQYKNLKEKIIGITIEFVPTVKDTLLDILEEYSGYPVYRSFLEKSIDELVKISEAAKNNFRHLKYGIKSLQQCFSQIRINVIDNKTELAPKVELELPNIILTGIALSIEFKSSELKYTDLKEFENDSFFARILAAKMSENGNQQAIEKTRIEKFLEKYSIKEDNYHIYGSIFQFVTAYEEFDVSKFIEEFKENFHLQNGVVLPHYQILRNLSYSNCFTLTDEEYKIQTLELIDFAQQGLFQPKEYPSIMHMAERLDNFLGLNLEQVRDKLIEGLRKAIMNSINDKQIDLREFEMGGRMSSLSSLVKQIYGEGLQQIELLKQQKNTDDINKVLEKLLDDPIDFERMYRTDSSFQYNLNVNSFLNSLNLETFLEKVKSFDSNYLDFLRFFFKERYGNSATLKAELVSIEAFLKLLSQYQSELDAVPGNKLRSYVVKQFSDIFDSAAQKGREFQNEHQRGV